MEYVKVTSALLLTGAISLVTYQYMQKNQERVHFFVQCENVFREQIIEAYPIVRLKYQKYKSFKDEGKSIKSEDQMRQKVLRAVTQDVALELCEKYEISFMRYKKWFYHQKNTKAQEFLRRVDRAVLELCTSLDEPPKSLDLEVKEDLKKKDMVLLAFRKYCDYQKHVVYQQIREELLKDLIESEDQKLKIVENLLRNTCTWDEVFKAMEIDINPGEFAELEYKKAYYKLKFDRIWNNEIQRIENQHYTIMGAIIQFTKATSPESVLSQNPLKLSNNPYEYKYEYSLSFTKDLSEELLLMLCQFFRQKFGRKIKPSEVKHQKLLDQIQQMIQQHTFNIIVNQPQAQDSNEVTPSAGFSGSHQNLAGLSTAAGTQSGSNTQKNLRQLLKNDISRRISQAQNQVGNDQESTSDPNQSFTKQATVSRRRARQTANQNSRDNTIGNKSGNDSQFLDMNNQSMISDSNNNIMDSSKLLDPNDSLQFNDQ
eukprot:403369086